MDFDFQQFFQKLWMHELRQILLNPYRIYGFWWSHIWSFLIHFIQ